MVKMGDGSFQQFCRYFTDILAATVIHPHCRFMTIILIICSFCSLYTYLQRQYSYSCVRDDQTGLSSHFFVPQHLSSSFYHYNTLEGVEKVLLGHTH